MNEDNSKKPTIHIEPKGSIQNEYEAIFNCPKCGQTYSAILDAFVHDLGDGDSVDVDCNCGFSMCYTISLAAILLDADGNEIERF